MGGKMATRRRRTGERRIIETDSDIADGVAALRAACGHMRRIHDAIGDPPLRRNPGGLAGLARVVVGQQVSVASAAAIWARFTDVAGAITSARLTAMTDDDFRRAGLSRPKVRTLRDVATAVDGGLDLDALASLDPDAARARLVAVRGIGPWTADIYLMFCVGHADVFAAGDLALQIAAQAALSLDARPTPDALATIAARRWAPWRAVAARLLWHHYAHMKAVTAAQPV